MIKVIEPSVNFTSTVTQVSAGKSCFHTYTMRSTPSLGLAPTFNEFTACLGGFCDCHPAVPEVATPASRSDAVQPELAR